MSEPILKPSEIIAELQKLANGRVPGIDLPSGQVWESSNELQYHVQRSAGLTTLLGAYLQWRATERCGIVIDEKEADQIELLLMKNQEDLRMFYDELQSALQVASPYLRLAEEVSADGYKAERKVKPPQE